MTSEFIFRKNLLHMERRGSDEFRKLERGTRVTRVYRYEAWPPPYNLCQGLCPLNRQRWWSQPEVQRQLRQMRQNAQHENNSR
jgi:hypothetical protein